MDRGWSAECDVMLNRDLRGRGIQDEAVLAAMAVVPRHRFVLPEDDWRAYADTPLPIPDNQTISQPYVVALMTEALQLKGGERVLEIGTGSGYQTAVLSELGAEIWTIEQSELLARQAKHRLKHLGYESIHFCCADGTLGLPSTAPYDCILAAGSLPEVPVSLLSQLKDGGIFVGPVGEWHSQDLVRIVYHIGQSPREVLCQCRFVPLIGENGWQS